MARWYCTRCDSANLMSRDKCFRCSTAKPRRERQDDDSSDDSDRDRRIAATLRNLRKEEARRRKTQKEGVPLGKRSQASRAQDAAGHFGSQV